MAKRPAFSPDEARAYLRTRLPADRVAAIKDDKYAQRLARGLSQGKSVSESRSHGPVKAVATPGSKTKGTYEFRGGERHSNRPYAFEERGDTTWRIGPHPDQRRLPDQQRFSRVPQPWEIANMIRRHSESELVSFGMHGFLRIYKEGGPERYNKRYVLVHVFVGKDELLRLLDSAPRDHVYTDTDPFFLALAHDLAASDTTLNGGDQASNGSWQWDHMYQWSVRDYEG